MTSSSFANEHVARLLNNLLWFEPFYLIALAFPLLLPNKVVPLSLHPYLLLLLFLFWGLRLFSSIFPSAPSTRLSILDRLIPSPLCWPILGLLSWLPVNLWASADRPLSYVSSGYLLLGVVLYVALINWPPVQRQPYRLAQFLALIGVVLAICAPFFTAWKIEFRLFQFPVYDMLRSVSLEALFGITETIHANVLAGTLVLILPILSILAIDKLKRYATLNSGTQKFPPIFLLSVSVLLVSVLVLSQSRGAYLAMVVSASVVASFRWPKLFFALLLAVVSATMLLFYYGEPFAALELISTDSALGGAEFRLDVWSNSLYAISDFSFTGIGIGTFNQIVPEFYPFAYVNGAFAHHAHNLYLQIALDMGLPGLIAYLLLIATIFWMLAAVLRSATSAEIRLLAIGACASCVALLAHGLLDAVMWGTKLAFVPWILFALITLLYRYSQRTIA